MCRRVSSKSPGLVAAPVEAVRTVSLRSWIVAILFKIEHRNVAVTGLTGLRVLKCLTDISLRGWYQWRIILRMCEAKAKAVISGKAKKTSYVYIYIYVYICICISIFVVICICVQYLSLWKQDIGLKQNITSEDIQNPWIYIFFIFKKLTFLSFFASLTYLWRSSTLLSGPRSRLNSRSVCVSVCAMLTSCLPFEPSETALCLSTDWLLNQTLTFFL